MEALPCTASSATYDHQLSVRNFPAGTNQGEILRTLLDEGSDCAKFGFLQRRDKLVRSQEAIPGHDFQNQGKLYVLGPEKRSIS